MTDFVAPRRNLEIKARIASLEAARKWRAVATSYLGFQSQTDTYFACRHGRLKLREIVGEPAVLIAYSRPDQPGAKGSDYHLIPDADALKSGLTAASASCKSLPNAARFFSARTCAFISMKWPGSARF